MKFPTSTILSKSIPVDNPIELSIYKASSVETFPEAPVAYGQPPKPATEESMTLISSSNET